MFAHIWSFTPSYIFPSQINIYHVCDTASGCLSYHSSVNLCTHTQCVYSLCLAGAYIYDSLIGICIYYHCEEKQVALAYIMRRICKAQKGQRHQYCSDLCGAIHPEFGSFFLLFLCCSLHPFNQPKSFGQYLPSRYVGIICTPRSYNACFFYSCFLSYMHICIHKVLDTYKILILLSASVNFQLLHDFLFSNSKSGASANLKVILNVTSI